MFLLFDADCKNEINNEMQQLYWVRIRPVGDSRSKPGAGVIGGVGTPTQPS